MTKFQTASPACFDMAANRPDKKTIRNASDRSGLFSGVSAHQNILRTPILTCQFWRIVCIEDLCASK
ncbi:hypothetical protein M791_09280 [Neisseria gonorrhoeae MU_NG26]|nr:hypothetical protein M724_11480 [Neisseria gonorrhoeae ATL_2011_01_05]KLS67740.1 hypothetical protein M741_06930 [Neisseria gonorrhoeae NOR_2011_03-06]KLT08506.1 hypothetical protein M791_09280 [Neisseria gonorrhoeae MU_NG26]